MGRRKISHQIAPGPRNGPYRTLADVARALGVDASTVSLVLSGSPKPSEETRRMVLDFCQEVEFRPNLLARGLSRGKSGLWGVLFPDIGSSFFPGILEGIEAVANEREITSFVALSKYDPELMRSQIIHMKARRVEGLLIVPTNDRRERDLVLPVLEGLPHVVLCFPFRGERLETVVRVDDELGGRIGAEHLIALGHRRIGWLAGPPRSHVARLRQRGWRQALRKAGLPAGDGLTAGEDFSSESGYRAAMQLLESPDPPTALFGVSDYAALGAIEAILTKGLRPGDDVAVVGYDDICCARYSPVPLTTVRQPKEELGVAAARALLQTDGGDVPAVAPLPPALTVRRSCGAAARGMASHGSNPPALAPAVKTK